MTSPYLNFKKDGAATLLKIARNLCALITAFAKVIKVKYEDNAAIIALLTACEGVCALLPDAEAEFAALPQFDAPPEYPIGTVVGTNPSAPPTEDPEAMA